jgi:hypothetical protein
MGKSGGSRRPESILIRALKILPRKDRTKVVLVAVIQIVLSFLDLIAVALIGILGSIALTGIQSGQPGDRVSFVIEFLHLSDMQFQRQVAILAVISAILLISRTVFSVIFIRKIFNHPIFKFFEFCFTGFVIILTNCLVGFFKCFLTIRFVLIVKWNMPRFM